MSENAVNRKFLMMSRKLRRDMTDCEKLLWNNINRGQLGVKFRRQYVIDNKYIVDFICLERKIIIELDGGQHCEAEEDIRRDMFLRANNFRILRFWNNDILDNMSDCLEKLVAELGVVY